MNKKILVLFAFILLGQWFYAQGPGRERVKTLKVAFITERVGLTSKEAQLFWPMYNEHEKNIESIRFREREQLAKMRNIQNLTEKEASNLLDKMVGLRNEKHKAQQDFIERISTVIPTKKVLLLLKAEKDFNRRLLQQMRKRRGG